ncbi:CHAP domain-containing protein [Kineosporia sp. J2-2]|uniref:CHAP domain-containing protein n=1 Tax=Kineosporia corallincola TaxID=2835133 RepID=A0ABS5TTL1_9ACTN|nr:CHAP domain-containing protein [Kineosporia corallincola]MBT0774134.1 CHAP domain-containing protein [Kineosporia corallincola]
MLSQKELAKLAEHQLGVQENPLGSNHVVLRNGDNLWPSIGLGWADGSATKTGQAWCGAFNYWLDCHAGARPPYSALTAVSCHNLEAWARKHHYWSQDPQVGDIVIFSNGRHQGRVVDVAQWDRGRGHVTTIEGNWANKVVKMQRPRHAPESIDGFVRRGYPATATGEAPAIPDRARHRTPSVRPVRPVRPSRAERSADPAVRARRSLIAFLTALAACAGGSQAAGDHSLASILDNPAFLGLFT